MSEEYEYDDDPLGEHEPKTQRDKSPIGELKPCPFCGSSNIRNIENGMEQNLTGCEDCGSRVSYKYNFLENAARAWNSRPIEDALQVKLDIAVEALKEIVMLPVDTTNELEARLWMQNNAYEALKKLEA